MMLSKWRLKESRLLSEGRRGLPTEMGDLRPPWVSDDASNVLKKETSTKLKGYCADEAQASRP